MSTVLPFLIFVLIVVALLGFSARARRRQAQTQADQASRIGVGSDVMTTSGLYGTVVARNDDDSVQMSIAPGVEVRWALAALRDVESLPPRFRTDRDDTEPGFDDREHRAPGVDLGKPRGNAAGGAEPAS
jgi:preprotein translocase subunit YajC